MKRSLWPALVLAALLIACTASPPTRLYLLAAPADADGRPAAGGAAVQLQAVLVPDYLDTTDILLRTGPHEVRASAAGRWGERLSLAMTHALQADLAARLPTGQVLLSPPADTSAMQVLVSVDAFDAWADGHCVLAAHWTVLKTQAEATGRTGQGVFSTPAGATGIDDAARVAAMAAALDQLAARIASDLRTNRGQAVLF